MADSILEVAALEQIWQTPDPFLFCVHHLDLYPKGNGALGPAASLQGHHMGQDFMPSNGDPWRMYHGQKIPGFPSHPHRGFETITVTLTGMIDHADSLGAAGRYGEGDTQWMTAGKGIQHAEMFPLLNESSDNLLDFFQIWLNLPGKNKMVEPYFGMFWDEETPVHVHHDEAQNATTIRVIAGDMDGVKALSAPPDSWAADKDNRVAVWVINMAAGAHWTIPADVAGLSRRLYYYEGEGLTVDAQDAPLNHYLDLKSEAAVTLKAGAGPVRLLLLQGRPIAEPVAQHGPFVMNTREELQQTFMDYQRTQFGGWPWPENEQTHGKDKGRFALYADGREELPPQSTPGK